MRYFISLLAVVLLALALVPQEAQAFPFRRNVTVVAGASVVNVSRGGFLGRRTNVTVVNGGGFAAVNVGVARFRSANVVAVNAGFHHNNVVAVNAGFHHHQNVAFINAGYHFNRVAFVGGYSYAPPVAFAQPVYAAPVAYGCNEARLNVMRGYDSPPSNIASEEVTITETDGRVTKTFRQFR